MQKKLIIKISPLLTVNEEPNGNGCPAALCRARKTSFSARDRDIKVATAITTIVEFIQNLAIIARHLILLVLPFCLAGCAALHFSAIESPRVELIPGQQIILPPPSQLKLNITATQILTAKYNLQQKTHIYTSQLQLETNPNHIIIMAITGWGGAIFSIHYHGNQIETTHLPLPDAHMSMGISHVLTDFILTYAPADLLKTLLQTTQLSLKTSRHERLFMLGQQKIIQINYDTANPWQGKVVLQNFYYHYTIEISTVAYHAS